ncbi:MAG TPA: DUF4148 domain-containing protein [Noviherbaspirillum sp.]|uniref:DUF4148 domain-containing protein n=1 Tax=Noviherbaspirillum sp. TaxID=1926288 RepID=UPI002B460850|nr:DUF4148 domain-containing protein [Noviherbaspirillum sp.]HJV84594.1 DUF4148 domain-containing protein [Noviherbaspirillum sp.]
MKSNKLATVFAFTALLTAGLTSAFAGDAVGNDNWVEFNNVPSTKTRAEVVAELNAARTQGLLEQNIEATYPNLPVARSTRSRDEVRDEAIIATRKQQRGFEYSSGQ